MLSRSLVPVVRAGELVLTPLSVFCLWVQIIISFFLIRHCLMWEVVDDEEEGGVLLTGDVDDAGVWFEGFEKQEEEEEADEEEEEEEEEGGVWLGQLIGETDDIVNDVFRSATETTVPVPAEFVYNNVVVINQGNNLDNSLYFIMLTSY